MNRSLVILQNDHRQFSLRRANASYINLLREILAQLPEDTEH